ncbi:lipoate--protein ligase family protein [Tundrisphaera lichenicola]|uniref:lipoate--protein ligase family protein n=1 Tax=Tundrisphaera lichenicola TaxID=2029860 RepID=UPI003EC08EEC
MAVDEALLDSVAADPSRAVVRCYSWSVPTLSLGYFQSTGEIDRDPRWRGVPTIRRSTGGGALWHDDELTYAVVVPSTHPASRPSTTLYRVIHGAIVGLLRSIGVKAQARGPSILSGESIGRPFLCFGDRDEDDIVLGGAKIVGSAQRRRSGAVLQHGSLLLGRSKITPELVGLRELTSIDLKLSYWIEALEKVLPDALGLSILPDRITPAEEQRAGELRGEVYENPTWMNRR